nr:hypothetical protein [Tanacetum cinerariifolium]
MTNKLQGVSFVANDDILEGDILSKFLPCRLLPKELNPGSFTLPCIVSSLNLYVMEDLGASVNVMPKSMFKHLKLVDLKKIDMLVEMADMTRKAPLGIVENILVKINKSLFPSDFIIIDMLGEPSETMILGCGLLVILTRFCSRYDAIYGKREHGMLEQWMCFWDNERQSVGGNRMIFAKFLCKEMEFEVASTHDYVVELLLSAAITVQIIENCLSARSFKVTILSMGMVLPELCIDTIMSDSEDFKVTYTTISSPNEGRSGDVSPRVDGPPDTFLSLIQMRIRRTMMMRIQRRIQLIILLTMMMMMRRRSSLEMMLMILAMPIPPPSPLTPLSSPLPQIPSSPLPASPPILPIPLPTASPPLQLLSSDRRANRPEVTLPPRKRLSIIHCSGYEAGESSATAAARPIEGRRADYGFVGSVEAEIRRRIAEDIRYGIRDTWIDPRDVAEEEALTTLEGVNTRGRQTEIFQRVEVLVDNSQYHYETGRLVDQEARCSREAWAHSIGLSSAVHFELQGYMTYTWVQDQHIDAQDTLEFEVTSTHDYVVELLLSVAITV